MGGSRKRQGRVSTALVELEVLLGRPSAGATGSQALLREVRVDVNCGCHVLIGSIGMRVDENGEM